MHTHYTANSHSINIIFSRPGGQRLFFCAPTAIGIPIVVSGWTLCICHFSQLAFLPVIALVYTHRATQHCPRMCQYKTIAKLRLACFFRRISLCIRRPKYGLSHKKYSFYRESKFPLFVLFGESSLREAAFRMMTNPARPGFVKARSLRGFAAQVNCACPSRRSVAKVPLSTLSGRLCLPAQMSFLWLCRNR